MDVEVSREEVCEVKADVVSFGYEEHSHALAHARVQSEAEENFESIAERVEFLLKLIEGDQRDEEQDRAEISCCRRLLEYHADEEAESDDGDRVDVEEQPDQERVAVREHRLLGDQAGAHEDGHDDDGNFHHDDVLGEPRQPVQGRRQAHHFHRLFELRFSFDCYILGIR